MAKSESQSARMPAADLALAAILAVSLLLRLTRLDAPPIGIFDEGRFYVPAAAAYLAGLPDPNFEHPPLGKLLIAAGMALLGDNPWGWRIAAAVAGTAGIALTAALARSLWGSPRAGALAALLLASDFLWLLFSRLAMLDIFLGFFVLLALVAAWRYKQSGRTPDLLWCGVAIGLAAAVKWSGGLALLPALIAVVIRHRNRDRRSILPLLALMAGVAVAAYVLPWVYYLLMVGASPLEVVALHGRMLDYHLHAGADALQAAGQYWEPAVWLLNQPQVLTSGDDRSQWVLAMSNPLLFWLGLAALLWLALRSRPELRPQGWFLLAAFLVFYLPWFGVQRVKYFYYLLPVLPILAVAAAGCLNQLLQEPIPPRRRLLVAAYLTATAAALLGAYPMITGGWTR